MQLPSNGVVSFNIQKLYTVTIIQTVRLMNLEEISFGRFRVKFRRSLVSNKMINFLPYFRWPYPVFGRIAHLPSSFSDGGKLGQWKGMLRDVQPSVGHFLFATQSRPSSWNTKVGRMETGACDISRNSKKLFTAYKFCEQWRHFTNS